MSKIATATLELKIDGQSFNVDLNKIKTGIGSLPPVVKQAEQSLQGIGASLKTVGTALGVAFSATAVVGAGMKLVNFASTLTDLSQRTGLSTTSLQKFNAAFADAGVEMETVAKASTFLSRAIASNNGDAIKQFQNLHLSLRDLKALAPEDQLLKVADAIGQMKNKGEQLAASKTLFGKAGEEILQGLNGHLSETVRRAEELGLVMDERTVKAADDFGDALGILGKQLLGVVGSLVGPLLPKLTELIGVLGDLARGAAGVARWFLDLPTPLQGVVGGALAVTAGLVPMVAGFRALAGLQVAQWALAAAAALKELGAMTIAFGWEGFAITIAGWAAPLTSAWAAAVRAATAFMSLGGAAGGIGSVAGSVVSGLGAIAVAVGATTAVVMAGYQAWMLYKESQERATLDAHNAAIDQKMLADASKIAGRAITDYAEGIRILQQRAAELRAAHAGVTAATKDSAAAAELAAVTASLEAAARARLSKALEDQIRKALAAGVTAEVITEKLKEQGIVGDVVALTIARLTAAQQKAKTAAEEHARVLKAQADATRDVDIATRGYLGVVKDLGAEKVQTIREELAHGAAVDDLAKKYAIAKASVEEIDQQLKKEAADRKALIEVMEGQAAVEAKNEDDRREAIERLVQITRKSGQELATLHETEVQRIDREWDEALQHLGTPPEGAKQQWEDAATAINGVFAAKLADAKAREALEHSGEQNAESFTYGFSSVLLELPEILAAAFTGGGGFSGAFKALGARLGASIAAGFDSTNLGTKVLGGLTGGLAKIFNIGGQAGIGALATGLTGILSGGISAAVSIGISLLGKGLAKIGGAFKRLFGGPSKDEREAADSIKSFEQSIEDSATAEEKAAAGNERWRLTVDKVTKAYLATGKTAAEAQRDVQALWKAGSKKEAEAAAKKLQEAIDLQKKALEELPKILDDVAAGINKVASQPIVSQEQFDRVGRLAVTAFNAAIAGGQTFSEAVAGITPALEQLAKAQTDLGFASSDTLQTLLGFSRFADANHEVLDALEGTRQLMAALQKMGRLTQQDFDDLNATASAAFSKMTEGGADANTALQAMQPTLQQIWQIQHDTGLVVDDTTQALIDQAVAQGIVGEHMKSVQEQTLDVLVAIAKVLKADIPDALNKLPTKKTIDVEARRTGDGWNPGFGGGEDGGGESAEGAGLGFATGTPNYGFLNFGRGTHAMLHGSEAVVPKAGVGGLAEQLASAIGPQLAQTSGPSGPINVVAKLFLNGREVTKTVLKDVLRNQGRARTILGQALEPEFS